METIGKPIVFNIRVLGALLGITPLVREESLLTEILQQVSKETADLYGSPGNYVVGANIAGFVKVVNSMIDQGVV